MSKFKSINPATGETVASFDGWEGDDIESALDRAVEIRQHWRQQPVATRCDLLRSLADRLEDDRDGISPLISQEMGKLGSEARAEVEKCAWLCRYYADRAGELLADVPVTSDASRSLVIRHPIGTVLAIMPWNFPVWQVMRCAVPAVVAGNTVLLKHATNVMGCAGRIEQLFADAGAPPGLFQAMKIDAGQAGAVVEDDRVRAVSLTGSEKAGRAVAAKAGEHLTRVVLELGGSDPFIVLPDADVEAAADAAVQSRFMNCGQSCIAAKRFLVADDIADAFTEAFAARVGKLRVGDPTDESTTLAPMARDDLRATLVDQIKDTIAAGARLLCGGQPLEGPGYFFAATILERVPVDSRAFTEEVFGPVAALTTFSDTDEAAALANASRFGLGASVWSRDEERAEAVARALECGNAFVNSIVKSDPRLPFGGVKDSGFGRELAAAGLYELTESKTLSIA